jgi:hypothetical protein
MASDHAPLVIDVNRPGHAFNAGWCSTESRIAAAAEPAMIRTSVFLFSLSPFPPPRSLKVTKIKGIKGRKVGLKKNGVRHEY